MFEEIFDPNEQIFTCSLGRYRKFTQKTFYFVEKLEYSIVGGKDFIVESDEKVQKYIHDLSVKLKKDRA